MKRVEESDLEQKVLKKLSFPYGNVYFFKHFVVSEINQDVLFTWELAKPVIDAAVSFYNNKGSDIVYISNRVNQYAVKPVDWLKFVSYSFQLKGYAVVSISSIARRNGKLESLFIPSKFKTFDNLNEAAAWAMDLQSSVKKT